MTSDFSKQHLFQQRAAQLAKPLKQFEDRGHQTEVVEFKMGNEKYGLEASYIREVYPLKRLTPLPHVPPFILGLVHIRRHILSVIDLKTFFGSPPSKAIASRFLILLENSHMEFAVAVDEILGVSHLDKSMTLSVEKQQRKDHFIKWVTQDFLTVLDAQKLLNEKSLCIAEGSP